MNNLNNTSIEIDDIASRLKIKTLPGHQQQEKELIKVIRAVNTPEKYLELLQVFYGFFAPLQETIDAFIGTSQVPDYSQRRNIKSLFNDIITLKGIIPGTAAHTEIPEIKNTLQAFGALYVLEGSSLGGKIIKKMISNQLGIQPTVGFSFFSSYGDDVYNMWASFKEVLNDLPLNDGDDEIIIDAADDTFMKLNEWISKHY